MNDSKIETTVTRLDTGSLGPDWKGRFVDQGALQNFRYLVGDFDKFLSEAGVTEDRVRSRICGGSWETYALFLDYKRVILLSIAPLEGWLDTMENRIRIEDYIHADGTETAPGKDAQLAARLTCVGDGSSQATLALLFLSAFSDVFGIPLEVEFDPPPGYDENDYYVYIKIADGDGKTYYRRYRLF